MPLTLTILGTGNPLPDPRRAGSAALVQAGSTSLLIDAGRGVVMRLAATGTLPSMLDAVLLTHLHSDHIAGLNDVITTHWIMSQEPRPLRIFGPPRTAEVVSAIQAMLRPDVEYRVAHHDDLTWEPILEVVELDAGDERMIGEVAVLSAATDHRPVEPTLGYRVSHGDHSVVLAGDSVPCASLDDLCAGADAYVQTVVREDLVQLVPSARFHDILDYHSSVEQAASTAQRAGVKTLVCTHYVPGMAEGDEDGWRRLATARFDGVVILADDLTVVEIT